MVCRLTQPCILTLPEVATHIEFRIVDINQCLCIVLRDLVFQKLAGVWLNNQKFAPLLLANIEATSWCWWLSLLESLQHWVNVGKPLNRQGSSSAVCVEFGCYALLDHFLGQVQGNGPTKCSIPFGTCLRGGRFSQAYNNHYIVPPFFNH